MKKQVDSGIKSCNYHIRIVFVTLESLFQTMNVKQAYQFIHLSHQDKIMVLFYSLAQAPSSTHWPSSAGAELCCTTLLRHVLDSTNRSKQFCKISIGCQYFTDHDLRISCTFTKPLTIRPQFRTTRFFRSQSKSLLIALKVRTSAYKNRLV